MKTLIRVFALALFFFLVSSLAMTSDIPQCLAVPERLMAAPQSWWDEVDLLCRVIMGEATGEPFVGQVAVGAVIMNRTRSPLFPDTLPGVIYDPDAFECVTNGLIWSRSPTDSDIRAAEMALNGWDPTYGSLFFWNPGKAVSPWIWTRQIVVAIGNHVFGY